VILPSQKILETVITDSVTGLKRSVIEPFELRTVQNGMSYGLSHAGYDIRIKEGFTLKPGEFRIAVSVEHFQVPDDLMLMVKDKSTWARRGLSVFNTVIEPGWRGWLTLELVNHSAHMLRIFNDDPIAQVIFHRLEEPTTHRYAGKYQDQGAEPTPARAELHSKP
jgi:dCTP deaminase